MQNPQCIHHQFCCRNLVYCNFTNGDNVAIMNSAWDIVAADRNGTVKTEYKNLSPNEMVTNSPIVEFVLLVSIASAFKL